MNQNTKKISIIIGVCVVAIFLYFVFSKPAVKNAPVIGKTIVAFGDSLIVGVGASEGKSLPSLLGLRLGKEIINAGRSGDTTEMALSRLESDVLSHQPDLVIVLLGGNDYLRRVNKKITFKNLREIIRRIQDTGAVVLLLGVRGGLLSDGFDEDFEKLADEMQTGYVSNVLKGLITNREYMYDSIHPNDKGYAFIADRIEPEISRLIR